MIMQQQAWINIPRDAKHFPIHLKRIHYFKLYHLGEESWKVVGLAMANCYLTCVISNLNRNVSIISIPSNSIIFHQSPKYHHSFQNPDITKLTFKFSKMTQHKRVICCIVSCACINFYGKVKRIKVVLSIYKYHPVYKAVWKRQCCFSLLLSFVPIHNSFISHESDAHIS